MEPFASWGSFFWKFIFASLVHERDDLHSWEFTRISKIDKNMLERSLDGYWEVANFKFRRETKERLSLTLRQTAKRQKLNFCGLSSAVSTVEWKYLYLRWIVGDIFQFLCGLFKDYKKREQIRGNLCRLPSAVNVMLKLSLAPTYFESDKWTKEVMVKQESHPSSSQYKEGLNGVVAFTVNG